VATQQPHSRFKIYDMVYSTPANTPGCDSSQSIALYGSVIALKFEDELMVKIKSSNDGRNQLWVPETRVNSTSKSIFDNSIIELRNSSVNKKLQNCTRKVTELKLCVKSFAPIYGENSRIKSNAKVLYSKIDQLKANYSVLSGEFQEISTSL
jgi:hypothetical protein